jgi:predicted secreted Zn-dependent protease
MTRGLTYCLILLVALLACGGDEPPLLAPEDSADGPPPTVLSVGPIEGLTTAWHPAPARIAVPVGTDVVLSCGALPGEEIHWSGAEPTHRDGTNAYAVCRMTTAGEHVVRVEMGAGDDGDDGEGGKKGGRPRGVATSHDCVITAVAVKPADIVVRAAAEVSPLGVAEGATNEETMQLFFAGGKRFQAVSALSRVSANHYRTAIGRVVRVTASVEPAVFAPMIEWRADGTTPTISPVHELMLSTPGPHRLSVGPPANAQQVRIDTYRVEIVSRRPAGPVLEGVPITFRARTIPGGFEDDITWISSTKYGCATPVVGRGPVFAATFDRTWGPHPDYPGHSYEWLGVRADNAVFNYDIKTNGMPQLAILEFVGRPDVLPPNGALYFPHTLCGAAPPVFPLGGERERSIAAITGATVCYYDITAANLNAACDSIFQSKGPVDPHDGDRHAGSTEMCFTANWRHLGSSETADTVHIESVTWSVKVWLPRWTNVPPGDLAAWNNLIKELEKHEQGHVDRFNNSMPTVNTQVSCTKFTVATGTNDSIVSVEANAKVEGNPAYQAGEQDQQKYDAPQSPSNPTGTNHGTQNGQNATWPSGGLLRAAVGHAGPGADDRALALERLHQAFRQEGDSRRRVRRRRPVRAPREIVQYRLPTHPSASIRFSGVRDRRVLDLRRRRAEASGPHAYAWDGRNALATKVVLIR